MGRFTTHNSLTLSSTDDIEPPIIIAFLSNQQLTHI